MNGFNWLPWWLATCIVLLLILLIFFDYNKRFGIRGITDRKCKHLRTRCVHGDMINYLAKVYVIRWWKGEQVYRQICRDCGKPLPRVAICTATGKDQHEWNGPWPKEFAVGEFEY